MGRHARWGDNALAGMVGRECKQVRRCSRWVGASWRVVGALVRRLHRGRDEQRRQEACPPAWVELFACVCNVDGVGVQVGGAGGRGAGRVHTGETR